jgi:hypothetical protein
MKLLAYLRALASSVFHSSSTERELDEELRSHIQIRADDFERSGLTRAEAERRARIEFGGLERFKEEVRDGQLGTWFNSVLSDCRYSFRGLIRDPIFATTAIVSLSLAIGANTAIYSVVDAALLRPLPVPQADRLFRLTAHETDGSGIPGARDGYLFSYPLYEQLCEAATIHRMNA